MQASSDGERANKQSCEQDENESQCYLLLLLPCQPETGETAKVARRVRGHDLIYLLCVREGLGGILCMTSF